MPNKIHGLLLLLVMLQHEIRIANTIEWFINRQIFNQSWQSGHFDAMNWLKEGCFHEAIQIRKYYSASTIYFRFQSSFAIPSNGYQWLLVELVRYYILTAVNIQTRFVPVTNDEERERAANITVFTADSLNVSAVIRGDHCTATLTSHSLDEFVKCGNSGTKWPENGEKVVINCSSPRPVKFILIRRYVMGSNQTAFNFAEVTISEQTNTTERYLSNQTLSQAWQPGSWSNVKTRDFGCFHKSIKTKKEYKVFDYFQFHTLNSIPVDGYQWLLVELVDQYILTAVNVQTRRTMPSFDKERERAANITVFTADSLNVSAVINGDHCNATFQSDRLDLFDKCGKSKTAMPESDEKVVIDCDKPRQARYILLRRYVKGANDTVFCFSELTMSGQATPTPTATTKSTTPMTQTTTRASTKLATYTTPTTSKKTTKPTTTSTTPKKTTTSTTTSATLKKTTKSTTRTAATSTKATVPKTTASTATTTPTTAKAKKTSTTPAKTRSTAQTTPITTILSTTPATLTKTTPMIQVANTKITKPKTITTTTPTTTTTPARPISTSTSPLATKQASENSDPSDTTHQSITTDEPTTVANDDNKASDSSYDSGNHWMDSFISEDTIESLPMVNQSNRKILQYIIWILTAIIIIGYIIYKFITTHLPMCKEERAINQAVRDFDARVRLLRERQKAKQKAKQKAELEELRKKEKMEMKLRRREIRKREIEKKRNEQMKIEIERQNRIKLEDEREKRIRAEKEEFCGIFGDNEQEDEIFDDNEQEEEIFDDNEQEEEIFGDNEQE